MIFTVHLGHMDIKLTTDKLLLNIMLRLVFSVKLFCNYLYHEKRYTNKLENLRNWKLALNSFEL